MCGRQVTVPQTPSSVAEEPDFVPEMDPEYGDDRESPVLTVKKVSNAVEAQTWLRSSIRKHRTWKDQRKEIFKRFGVKHLEQIPKDCMLQIAQEFGIDLNPLGKYAAVLEEKPKGGLSRNKLKSAIRSHPAFHANIQSLLHHFELKDHVPRTSKSIDYMGRSDLERLYALLHELPSASKAQAEDIRIIRTELRKKVTDLLAKMDERASFLRKRFPELSRRNVKPNLYPAYLRVSELKQLLGELTSSVYNSVGSVSIDNSVPALSEDEFHDDDDNDDDEDYEDEEEKRFVPKQRSATSRKRRIVVKSEDSSDESDVDVGRSSGPSGRRTRSDSFGSEDFGSVAVTLKPMAARSDSEVSPGKKGGFGSEEELVKRKRLLEVFRERDLPFRKRRLAVQLSLGDDQSRGVQHVPTYESEEQLPTRGDDEVVPYQSAMDESPDDSTSSRWCRPKASTGSCGSWSLPWVYNAPKKFWHPLTQVEATH